MDVFSVFDSLTVTSNGLGDAQGQVPSTGLSSPRYQPLAPGVSNVTSTSALVATRSIRPWSQLGSNLQPSRPDAIAGRRFGCAVFFSPCKGADSGGWPGTIGHRGLRCSFVRPREQIGRASPTPYQVRDRIGLATDSVLDELASDAGDAACGGRGVGCARNDWRLAVAWDGDADPGLPAGPMVRQGPPRQSSGFAARLAVILLAAGSIGHACEPVEDQESKKAPGSRRLEVHQFLYSVTDLPRVQDEHGGTGGTPNGLDTTRRIAGTVTGHLCERRTPGGPRGTR